MVYGKVIRYVQVKVVVSCIIIERIYLTMSSIFKNIYYKQMNVLDHFPFTSTVASRKRITSNTFP